jgi:hypothetical protein
MLKEPIMTGADRRAGGDLSGRWFRNLAVRCHAHGEWQNDRNLGMQAGMGCMTMACRFDRLTGREPSRLDAITATSAAAARAPAR